MRRFSFDIICKFSFGMDPECFIPSFLESKLADRKRRREMVTTTGLNKSNLLSRFMGSIKDDKYDENGKEPCRFQTEEGLFSPPLELTSKGPK
ncbi:hypothetical protein Ahy_B03g063998 [Arachis hypogaea]|uniref:Uncharacterized protein n=1 Tax=Arachis hypogaea TaxID=3818 RepID=A0A444ZYW6_ARAHY|nr:hypothetical protein Ahy_B03g063998 [Arachis hypogaea]